MPIAIVAEDDPFIRMDAADVLRDLGYEVIEANDANDANEAIAAMADCSDLDLLFTDIEMPGELNGLDLARAASQRVSTLKIIIASGRFSLTKEDMPVGASFLSKPYSSAQIAAALDEHRLAAS